MTASSNLGTATQQNMVIYSKVMFMSQECLTCMTSWCVTESIGVFPPSFIVVDTRS